MVPVKANIRFGSSVASPFSSRLHLKNHHEGIVDRELWNVVQILFNDGKKNREPERHKREKIMAVLRKEPGLKKGEIFARIGKKFGQLLNRMKRRD